MSFIIQEQATPVLFEIGKEEPTGAGGTIDFYLADQDFLYFEGNASANFAIDLAYDAATTLDDALNVDDLINITLSVKNGTTPYVLTDFQIDGGAGTITINWEGGNAPVIGTSNGVDVYQFSILKTSGNEYTVFAKVETTSKFIVSPNKELIINEAASATNTIYLSKEDIVFYTQTATTGFNINITYATGVNLNSVMSTGDVKEVSFKTLMGTGAAVNGLSIDGSSAIESIYFQDPIASATPGFINDYQFQIVKTGDQTFDVDINKVNLNPAVGGFALTVDILVIGGGGGGGYGTGAGGGGAGGMQTATPTIYGGTAYTVTVGAGGPGGTAGRGSSGSSSSFFSTTSLGGGGGASTSQNITGLSGGSGGGGTQDQGPGGAGTAGQGNNGGAGGDDNKPLKGGGGGGKGAVGETSSTSLLIRTGGAGGAGQANSITGSSVTYAGGGGGAAFSNGGVAPGGTGGGGAGGSGSAVATATPGTANTGGGGGGAGCDTNPPTYSFFTPNGNGGNGGKGIVVISAPRAAAATTGSPTVTTSGGKTIYQFLDSGTITF